MSDSWVVWLVLRVALTWTWALPAPRVWASIASRLASRLVVVAFFGGLFAGGAVDAFAVLGGPQELPGAVGDRDLADLQARDGGRDELGDAVHGGGAHVAGPAEQDGGGGGVLAFAEELVLGAGHDELDLRAGDALDVVDRLLELALQRALVGDPLVELAFAEARFFKEREAGLGIAKLAGAGERDARAGGLVGLDGERGAVVLQFVADALGGRGCSSSCRSAPVRGRWRSWSRSVWRPCS